MQISLTSKSLDESQTIGHKSALRSKRGDTRTCMQKYIHACSPGRQSSSQICTSRSRAVPANNNNNTNNSSCSNNSSNSNNSNTNSNNNSNHTTTNSSNLNNNAPPGVVLLPLCALLCILIVI